MTDCAMPRHEEPEDAGHAHLCHGCLARLRRDLRRLPQLDRDLEALMDPRRTITYGSGGSGGGLPFHEHAGECRSQIAHDAEAWVTLIIEDRQPAAWPVRTLPAMCAWLAGWTGWAAWQPWAPDMASVFAEVRGRAWALLDPMPRADIPLPRDAACPQCGARGSMRAVVYQGDGDPRQSVITCHGCRHQWEPSQWYRLGIILSRQQQRKEAA